MPLRGLLLLAFFVCSLPVCFVRPFYGILLWTVIAFLNPQSFTWAADMFPWAMAVAIPTIGGLLLFGGGRWNMLQTREVGLLIALWIWFTLSTVVSTSTPLFMHHASDTWYRWSFVSKILFMTVMTTVIVTGFERLRWFVLVIAGSFGVFVAKSFPFVILSGGAHRVFGPERSMIADNNDFGLAMNMTLPLFFCLAQTENKAWARYLWGALFFMAVPVIFFTYSRGALVGLVAVSAALMTFLQMKHRLLMVPVICTGVLIALLFAPDSWKRRMNLTNEETTIDASAQSRLDAWAFCRNLANDYPITGGGFSTFTPELFSRYAPGIKSIGPHSVYFQLLAEHGYIGLGLFLSLVLCCFATARKLVQEARRRQDHVIRHYANMFRFSLIGFLASGLFLGRAYFDYWFAIAAGLVILKKAAQEEWRRDDLEEWEHAEEEQEDEDSLPQGIAPFPGSAAFQDHMISGTNMI